MKETLLATYERKSTLWKNANLFYKNQDWVKMECFFFDYSETRRTFKAIDDNGVDVTDVEFADRYVIILTNERGNNSRSFEFATREEANERFLEIFKHKNLPGWRKAQ